jgi:hypothetical protein
MPSFPDVVFFELSPDWVCEVVSPSTGRLNRVRKMPKYAANEVRHLWLVDPSPRTVEVSASRAAAGFCSPHTAETRPCTRSPSTRSEST